MAGAGLKVKFSADTSALDRGMAKVRTSVGGIATKLAGSMFNVAKATAAVGTAAATAATAFSAWKIKEVLDLGGKMSDMSARTGVAAGEIKVLEEALRLAGIEGADTAKILQILGKNIATAVADDSGKAAAVLAALGLDARELVSMPLDQAFVRIGRAIAGMKNEAERAKASQELLGKAGMPLVALWKDFDNTMSSARGNVGGLIGVLNMFSERFDKVSDSIGAFPLKFQQFFGGLASEVLPQMENAFGKIGEIDLTEAGRRIGRALSNAISGESQTLILIGELIAEYVKQGIKTGLNVFGWEIVKAWGEKTYNFNKNIPWIPQQLMAGIGYKVMALTEGSTTQEVIQGSFDTTRIRELLEAIARNTGMNNKEPLVQY